MKRTGDILNRISLVPKMFFIVVLVGTIVWGLLDYFNTKTLRSILEAELSQRLSKQAVENRVRFDNYVGAYNQTARLIVSQKNFLDHISAGKWPANVSDGPLKYSKIPPWLPDASVMRRLVHIHYAVLIDSNNIVREIYQDLPEDLPRSVFNPASLLRQLSVNQSFMTMIDGNPYVITSESITDLKGRIRTTLLLVDHLDDEFLEASQGMSSRDNIVALVGVEHQDIFASNRPELLKQGVSADTLKNDYIITDRSFLDWGASDLKIQFTTLISRAEFRSLNQKIIAAGRVDRAMLSFALIISFLIIIYIVIRQVQTMTEKIVRLSKDELIIEPRNIPKGDQLFVLKNLFDRYLKEVVEAREAKYRSLFENAGDAIFMLETEGENAGSIISANQAAAEMHGYTVEELMAMNIKDLDAPASSADMTLRVKRILEGEWIKEEIDHKRKDGSIFPVEISAGLIETGGKRYILAFDREISLRKSSEEALRRNYDTQFVINSLLQFSLEDKPLEEILQQALDLILSIRWLSFEARGGIFIADRSQNTLIMKAHRGLSEYILKECAVVPFGKCLCGRAALTQKIQFACGLDERHEISYEGMTPHGHYCVPILLSKKPIGVINIYLSDGHQQDEREVEFLKAIANALAGIIQRKEIESESKNLMLELQEAFTIVSRSQKEWRNTFDNITDLIFIYDKNFNIIKANKAFIEYFGLTFEELINKKCHTIFYGTESPPPESIFNTALTENQPFTREIHIPKTNRIFSVSSFRYYSIDYSVKEEVQGVVSIARDVTEERENEARFIISERLASLGQMASGIAHEINNPLAAIAGCAEGLLGRIEKEQYQSGLFKRYLEIIKEEVLRCKGITTSMLSFVRETAYEKKEISINQILDKTMEIIGFQGRLIDIEVIKEYNEKLPVFYGSEGELKQVFLSIISNALDSMEDKGVIRLETDLQKDMIIIKISDTGPGITQENISRIFDPFFTTKSGKGGTGLGLSIAQRIINNHNGRIDVDSEAGLGTTFSIYLPRNNTDK